MAQSCLKQHSHMVKERCDFCSSNVMSARAVTLDLEPYMQKILPPKFSG
jgi:hypothetical protein